MLIWGCLASEADQPDRARDRQTGDEQRHARGDERAEDEHQDEGRDRQRDVSARSRSFSESRGGVLLDRPEAGELDRVAGRRRERGLDRRRRVATDSSSVSSSPIRT